MARSEPGISRIALITGGASGMGRVMAVRLADRGWRVAIVDLNPAMLAETAGLAPGIRTYTADVADTAQVRDVVGKITADMGPIDRLATAAAIMPALAIDAMPAETFAKVMRVNYEGTVNFVKAVLPQMRSRGSGEIVLFGSTAGVIPAEHFAAYGATKAAVNLFGEVLSQETRGTGIRVLTVRPAAVNTPLIAQASGEGGLKGLDRQLKKGTMTGPETIVDAIEAALAKPGLDVLYPTGEAWFAQFIRRLSPGLTWKLVRAMSQ
ncbi:MAG TPA: SDR family oxidoreductase [Nevskiaceae bacterium]|nr:SDR family oxidoreductase [Nevskiaceae bacterium]